MNILIIEDEFAAARRLTKLILASRSDVVIVGELDSVKGAVEWFRNNEMPDAAFVDVQLADGNCFSIFKQCTVTCPIVFVTAHDEYAIQAFDVNAVAYILKPVREKELQNAMQKLAKTTAVPDYTRLFDLLKKEDKF